MEYYFYLIFVLSLIALLGSLKRNSLKSNFYVVFFSILTLILFQSLRKSTIGIDVVTYLNFFERLSTENIENFQDEYYSLEVGYLYFNKFIGLLTSDNQLFLGVISAAIFLPIGYVIYKNSVNVYLSIIALVTLGIFNFSFSGLRQSIAIGLVFLSYEFIKKRKLLWFILIVLLASSFHKSALVFLAAYPLYSLKIKKKHFLIVLVLIAVIFSLKSFLLRFFISTAFEKYDNSELLVETGAYTMFFVMLFIYSLSVFIKNQAVSSEKFDSFSNYMLVAVIIQIAASESQIAMRAGYYYYIFVILLLPEMINSLKYAKIKKGLIFVALVFCLIFYYYTTYASVLNPFLFYWE